MSLEDVERTERAGLIICVYLPLAAMFAAAVGIGIHAVNEEKALKKCVTSIEAGASKACVMDLSMRDVLYRNCPTTKSPILIEACNNTADDRKARQEAEIKSGREAANNTAAFILLTL